jgi:hypothetical protein
MKTHYEYVPPITEKGRECIRVITEKFHACNESMRLETQLCRERELLIAKSKFNDAQIAYQKQLGEAEMQRAALATKNDELYLTQKKEYEDCTRNNETLKNKYNYELESWEIKGKKGFKPTFPYLKECRLPQKPVNNNQRYTYTPRSPILADFLQDDAHCFSITECSDTYNLEYEQCTGTVIKNTKCFANCD